MLCNIFKGCFYCCRPRSVIIRFQENGLLTSLGSLLACFWLIGSDIHVMLSRFVVNPQFDVFWVGEEISTSVHFVADKVATPNWQGIRG